MTPKRASADEGESLKLSDNFNFLVNGLARLLRNNLEIILKDQGHTPTGWIILTALHEEDGISQTVLARRAFLDNATTTRTLDILEEKDFVTRKRTKEDRRCQIIELTSLGREMYPTVEKFGSEVNEQATAFMTPTERKRLNALLEKVVTHVSRDLLKSRGVLT